MSGNVSMQLEIGFKSDIGRVRKNNEDKCRALAGLQLFIISDGMGGETHGELASAIATDTIVACCSDNSEQDASDFPELPRPDLSERTNRLATAVRIANRRIYESALYDPQLHGMGATVVAAWIEGPRLSVVHVGDSRAYLLRSGELNRLTGDHTLVAEQVRRGLIRPEEAHLSKMQNVLIRALGAQKDVEMDAAEFMLIDHDILLLCTDGLTRMVSDSEIAETLIQSSEAQTNADKLVLLANQNGGEDNVSVIVLHIAGAPSSTTVSPSEDLRTAS
jgi:serine/threonine protein phosphatase PrpC